MDWPPAHECALVLGGGHTVWKDVAALEAALGGYWPGLVIAANDIGIHWPRRLDHWVTLHPERLVTAQGGRPERPAPNGWVGLRIEKGGNRPTTWCHAKMRRWSHQIDNIVPQWCVGSSGLLAVTVAYELGAMAVVLCGVPMTDSPHFRESHIHGGQWTQFRIHRDCWKEQRERLGERTTSMSGWTRELLGAPVAGYEYDPAMYGDRDIGPFLA